MKSSIMTICYNDNDNTFTDEFGQVEYDISDIMEIDQVLHYKKVGGAVYANINNEEFEILFPVRDDYRMLSYDIHDKCMYDEEGDRIFNLYSIIRPNDMLLFLKNRQRVEVRGVLGGLVELRFIG